MILLQQTRCHVRATTWVTWKAVCSCSHKNETWKCYRKHLCLLGCYQQCERIIPMDRFMHPSGSWCGKPSMHPPQSFRKQRLVAQFQESEVYFGCFGLFDQIGRGGEIKIPLGSEAHCCFHAGVEGQLGFEFLLVNLPQLWARIKTRGCSFPQPGRRQPNAPGHEWLFSGDCFFSRAFCYLVILLTSWAVTCQYFYHQEARPLGWSLNLEAEVCHLSPSIPSRTAALLRLWNPKPFGWRANTFPTVNK